MWHPCLSLKEKPSFVLFSAAGYACKSKCAENAKHGLHGSPGSWLPVPSRGLASHIRAEHPAPGRPHPHMAWHNRRRQARMSSGLQLAVYSLSFQPCTEKMWETKAGMEPHPQGVCLIRWIKIQQCLLWGWMTKQFYAVSNYSSSPVSAEDNSTVHWFPLPRPCNGFAL